MNLVYILVIIQEYKIITILYYKIQYGDNRWHSIRKLIIKKAHHKNDELKKRAHEDSNLRPTA